MPTVHTPRLNFHYLEQGDADGLPMLLLHGSHGCSRWWTPFLALLPDEIRAIAPDLRGCGRSDKPDSGYTIEEQAADLYALVEVLGLTAFDLVAHSTSAAIAVEYLLAFPNAASTLTLVNPVPMEGIFTPVDTLSLLEAMRSDRALHRNALAAMMPAFDPAASDEDAAFFEALLDDAQTMAPPAFTEVAVSLNGWSRLADAGQLTLPTLLFWGDRDEIVNRDAITHTLITIPGANNLEVLPGVGHSPMIEAPLLLAERLFDFLSDDENAFEEIRRSAYEKGGTDAGQ